MVDAHLTKPGDLPRPDDLAKPAAEPNDRMRQLAGGGVVQARKAYEQYSGVTERAIGTMEASFRQAWIGVRDINQRMMTFADLNAKLGFDYAEKMAGAQNPNELVTLQGEYLRLQTERFGAQMRELNELAARATREAQDAAKARL